MSDTAIRIQKVSLFPRQRSMGLSLWESRQDGAANVTGPGSRNYGNYSEDVYRWQLSGPFETRMRLPAAPMPSMVDNHGGIPPTGATKRRNNGRQTRRRERHILDWLNRDDLSPKYVVKSPRKKLKPITGEREQNKENKPNILSMPQLPRISIDGVLSDRKPLARHSWYDHQIYHKEINFTPPGHRRIHNPYNHPELIKYPQWSLEATKQRQPQAPKPKKTRLDPIPAETVSKLRPPSPPPQSLNTPAQSKAPTNTEDNNPTTEEDVQSNPHPRVGWDPRRHYLQAHFRGLECCREIESVSLPCDLRDPNDSFAYNDVIEYMLDNDLMSLAKIRHISKWIEETLPPGFIYDDQTEWFIALDPEIERKSISSISSVSR